MKHFFLFCHAFFISLALAIPSHAATDDGMNSGIIYGKHHAFTLSAPPGWVLDNQSGVSRGLYAVFYPKEETWQTCKAFMYANTTLKEKGDSLESFMADDVSNYRKNRSTKKIEDAAPLAISNGNKVPVKYFLGDMNGNYEAVAYVDEKYIVAFLVLTAPNEALFRKDLPLFQKLVASYGFLTDKVHEEASTDPPILYAIPPNILKLAQMELKTPEGDSYDQQFGEAVGPRMPDYMKACASGKDAMGWHRIVLILDKAGNPTQILADKHDVVNDFLAPKFQQEKFPPPPKAPFYYLFEMEVKK